MRASKAGSPIVLLVLLALAGPVAAKSVLDGPHGDKDGCHYAKTGESSGSDTFFLLTDEGVTTATAACTFDGAPRKVGSDFRATITCESEDGVGEPETVDIRTGPKGRTVVFEDGTTWGPLPKCR